MRTKILFFTIGACLLLNGAGFPAAGFPDVPAPAVVAAAPFLQVMSSVQSPLAAMSAALNHGFPINQALCLPAAVCYAAAEYCASFERARPPRLAGVTIHPAGAAGTGAATDACAILTQSPPGRGRPVLPFLLAFIVILGRSNLPRALLSLNGSVMSGCALARPVFLL